MWFKKSKSTISNERDFYIRIGDKNKDGVYEHIRFFKGKLLDKNIWIDDVYDIPDLDLRKDIKPNFKSNMKKYTKSSIFNFNWVHGITYSLVSGGKVNTHLDWVVRGKDCPSNARVFVLLTDKEVLELKKMFGELPPYKRDPFQFWLLVFTGIGAVATAVLLTIHAYQSESIQRQQLRQHKELLHLMKRTDVQPQNHIKNNVVIDSITVGYPKH